MWKLKYEYKHLDCLYTNVARRLQITDLTYPLNYFYQKKKAYLTAIHVLEGEKENIYRYANYLKKIAKKYEEIAENIIFTLIEIRNNSNYYKKIYNPLLIYPAPIVHKNGKEYVQIASWDRSYLAEILNSLQRNKNTQLLKVLSFREEKIKDIFLMRIMPNITEKQRKVFELAVKEGYYNYPRKIDLQKLSQILKISKSNLHEILRRAEANILKHV